MPETPSYRIVPLRPDQRSEVLMVLRECLGPHHDAAWFEWKHLRNPFGESIAWIAEDDQGVVGCNFFMAYRAILEGRVVAALRSCESATLPRGRRRGIFSANVRACQKLVAESQEYVFLFGTPNPASSPGFQKLGWTTVSTIRNGISAIAPGSPSTIENAQGAFEAIAAAPPPTDLFLQRTREWLTWRYSSASGRDYQAASLANASAPNGIVYRVADRRGLRLLIVMEATGADNELRELVRSVARRERAWLVISATGAATIKSGSRPLLKRGVSELIAFAPGAPQVLEPANWGVTLGDLEGIL